MGLYYEEFTVGQEYVTVGRTVTETDVVLFAGLTGDQHQLHTDEQWSAQETPFGGRIAHGLLGMAIGVGLSSRLGLTDGTTLANLGINWRFTAPIRPGDTIRSFVQVSDKRLTSKPGRGIVTRRIIVRNQHDEIVSEGEIKVMIRCSPQAGS